MRKGIIFCVCGDRRGVLIDAFEGEEDLQLEEAGEKTKRWLEEHQLHLDLLGERWEMLIEGTDTPWQARIRNIDQKR